MNKKRSNEYGFTLIELLVTIAIMLSITVLAIVNIVGVSNKKKEEAWVSVKEEIETAASDYFKYNEYLFEGLGGTGTGTISVGSLVSDDYINKVTDPRTGKALSYCTKVNVTKTNRGITTEIDDDTISSSDNPEDCKDTYSVTVSNAKNAPRLKVEKKCGVDGENNWCIGDDKPKAIATATPVNGSEVISIEKDNNTGGNYRCDTNLTSSDNDKKKSCILQKETKEGIMFVAKSADGGIAKYSINIWYDNSAPIVDLTITSNNKNFKTKNTKINATITEKTSHVASVNSFVGEDKKDIFGNKTSEYSKDSFTLKNENYLLFDKYSGSSKTVKVIAKDEAGNEGSSSKSYTVYKNCKNKKETSRGKCSNTCGTGTQTIYYKDNHTGDVCTDNKKCSDNSGCKLVCDNDLKITTIKIDNKYTKGLKIETSSNVKSYDYEVDSKSGKNKTKTTEISNYFNYKNSITYKVNLKNSQGVSTECSGTITLAPPPEPSCPTISARGTEGNKINNGENGENGWYIKKPVELSIKNYENLKKWSWNISYNGNYTYNLNTSINTLKIDNEGKTGVSLTVSNDYRSKNCSWQYYNIDTVPPELVEWKKPVVVQTEKNNINNVYLQGQIKNNIICLKNVTSQMTYTCENPDYKDDTSGLNWKSLYFDVGDIAKFNLDLKPKAFRYTSYIYDYAGNKSKIYKSPDVYQAIIQNEKSKSFYSKCGVNKPPSNEWTYYKDQYDITSGHHYFDSNKNYGLLCAPSEKCE